MRWLSAAFNCIAKGVLATPVGKKIFPAVALLVALSGYAAAVGTITVTAPASGAKVSLPFNVHFTYSGKASYTKLWIDSKAIVVEKSGSTFDYSVTSLSVGTHTLALQAADSPSGTVVSVHIPITVSTTTPTALTVAPNPAVVTVGQSQAFTSSGSNVTFSVSPASLGTFNGATFTAGSPGTGIVTAKDSSGATGTASLTVKASTATPGTITVTAPASGTTVSLPFNVHFIYNGTADYTKLWSDGVSITAEQNGSTFDYTVTSLALGSHNLALQAHDAASKTVVTAHVSITVSATLAAITVSPNPAAVVVGESQVFSSSGSSVTYSVSPTTLGVFSGAGFTAQAPGSGTVTAKDGSGATGTASITVSALTITPTNPSVAVGQPQTFTANAPVDWSVTAMSGGGGSVPGTCKNTTSCVFTAGTSTGSATVTATEPGSTISTNTGVTVTALTLTPSSASTAVNQTQQFQANAPISNWQSSCGANTIAPSTTDNTLATFTAPSSVPNGGKCTISATDAGGAIAQATDTVTAAADPSGLNYTTWKYSSDHAGVQPHETVLTPANVNSTTFGLKFTDAVDGSVYAQPLYLSGLTVNGATHNVVFVATEHDSVYAFDADQAGSPLWQTSFLINGATTYDTTPSGTSTLKPEVGITGTPVIDISNGVQDGVLYVVAETVEGGKYVHRLHALEVATGAEIPGSPVTISAPGFASQYQLQRPALILANGDVYIAFGSQADKSTWHGWIFAYATNTLSQVAVWNATPGGNGGGIWGGGAGISADSQGNIYASTGNGNWDGTTQYGDSWIKLSPTLNVLDFFTPYDQQTLASGDGDLGSGLPVLVSQPGSTYPNQLIGCGKPAPVYVVNRDSMGGFQSGSDSQIIQELSNVVGVGTSGQRQYKDHCFTTPAYFQSNVYIVGNNDVIRMFSLDPSTGMLSTAPVSQGSYTFLFPGSQPVISSNGTSNGIVWALDYTSYYLHAYDAGNLATELFRSASVGSTKWTVPTVINGKVYVGSSGKLSVFGLL